MWAMVGRGWEWVMGTWAEPHVQVQGPGHSQAEGVGHGKGRAIVLGAGKVAGWGGGWNQAGAGITRSIQSGWQNNGEGWEGPVGKWEVWQWGPGSCVKAGMAAGVGSVWQCQAGGTGMGHGPRRESHLCGASRMSSSRSWLVRGLTIQLSGKACVVGKVVCKVQGGGVAVGCMSHPWAGEGGHRWFGTPSRDRRQGVAGAAPATGHRPTTGGGGAGCVVTRELEPTHVKSMNQGQNSVVIRTHPEGVRGKWE